METRRRKEWNINLFTRSNLDLGAIVAKD